MSQVSPHTSLPGGVYEALFAQGIDGFLLTSPEGRIHRANARACELLGWSEAEIAELGRADLADRRDPAWTEAVAVRGRDAAYRGVLRMRRRDGSTFPSTFPAEVTTALSAQTGMVGPLSTILMGVLLLGEPFTAWIAAGTVLVIAGIYVFTRPAPR